MHLCDYAFAADGGKQCLIGIFTVIHAQSFPATHPQMVVAVEFTGAPHERISVRVELMRPEGDSLASIDGEIIINADGRANLSCNLLNLAFPEPGRYTVNISAGDRILASRTLRLLLMQTPQPPSGVVH